MENITDECSEMSWVSPVTEEEVEKRSHPIDQLPPEILLHIFSFLPLQDLIAAQGSCKRWKNLIDESRIGTDFVQKCGKSFVLFNQLLTAINAHVKPNEHIQLTEETKDSLKKSIDEQSFTKEMHRYEQLLFQRMRQHQILSKIKPADTEAKIYFCEVMIGEMIKERKANANPLTSFFSSLFSVWVLNHGDVEIRGIAKKKIFEALAELPNPKDRIQTLLFILQKVVVFANLDHNPSLKNEVFNEILKNIRNLSSTDEKKEAIQQTVVVFTNHVGIKRAFAPHIPQETLSEWIKFRMEEIYRKPEPPLTE